MSLSETCLSQCHSCSYSELRLLRRTIHRPLRQATPLSSSFLPESPKEKTARILFV